MRTITMRLLALAALVGCGGSLETTASDGGTGASEAPSNGTADGGRSAPSSPESPSGGGTGGSSPGAPASDGGSCATSAPTFSPPDSSAACWSCVAKGCATQLAACAGDCACSDAVAGNVSCVNRGGAADCFASNIGPGNDDALTAVDLCVLQASYECGCEGGPPDAGTACVQTGGSGSGGNGQCTSTFGETCGGANYQVVCACPAGSCVCFSDADPDAGPKVVKFAGCPYCPGGPGPNASTDLLALCGFPH